MCLIPEIDFKLFGKRGLLTYVKKVLHNKGHCVICVAEGAGQVSKSHNLHFLNLNNKGHLERTLQWT